MKKTFLALLVFSAALFSTRPAAAQTAAEMDQVLNAEEITYSQAAWFTLASAMAIPPENPDAAFRYAKEQGWLQKKAEAAEPASFGGLSFLLTGAFNISGGFMYRLFPGPRYAYRELVYLRLIRGKTDPALRPDGKTFLHILGGVMAHSGLDAVLAKEDSQRQFLEDVSGSLQDDANQIKGLSSSAEDMEQYEGEFELE
ncbi:MAG: hypothetical protein LBE10_05285 [Treponema sp.]|jgi:hypothetical protein|nr:hypothetical protein [Treponema sp.]